MAPSFGGGGGSSGGGGGGGSGAGSAAAGQIGGAVIGAAGDYLTGRANANFSKAQQKIAQDIANKNYAAQKAWQSGLQGNPLFQQMLGNQVSTSSGYDNSTTKFDERSKGRLSSEFSDLPDQIKNRYQEASLRPIFSVLQEAGVLGRERTAANQASNRIAAQHGVSAAALGPTPADRQANAALSDAGLRARDQEYALQGQNIKEQAQLANMLKEVFKTGTTETRGREQSTTTGPGNALAALQLLAPIQRQRFVS
jgi:hypothetical protein